MSIARRKTKNAKVREDLNASLLTTYLPFQVLMDLERAGNTFFYRHIGPNEPKEVYSCDAPFRKINFNLTF